jgi:DUF4097 and DUF4098 domain-containing protein YvlB
MPVFDTPDPISVSLDIAAGDVRLAASDRTDTVVTVQPRNPSSKSDLKTVEQTRVEYSQGDLQIKGPRHSGLLFGWVGSVEVLIELPTGSDVRGTTSSGNIQSEGRLGRCRLKSGSGDIRLDQTGALVADTASGHITVGHATESATLSTASGDITLRAIDGAAVVKTSSGDLGVGEATGSVRLNTASGKISVRRALSDVVAKSANGSIRIGEVVRGAIHLNTASGELEIGIREGTAAWLDLNAHAGSVRNSLAATDGPGSDDETVEVRAQTSSGDILIHRAVTVSR